MSIATTTMSAPVTSIRILENRNFIGSDWREAILTFLNGVWSDHIVINHPAEICFNNIRLQLGQNNEYYVYFLVERDGTNFNATAPYNRDAMYIVSYPSANDVEAGLIRFVRNNKIRQLVIGFPGVGRVTLTKDQKRGSLFVSAEFYIPSMQAEMRRNGHSI